MCPDEPAAPTSNSFLVAQAFGHQTPCCADCRVFFPSEAERAAHFDASSAGPHSARARQCPECQEEFGDPGELAPHLASSHGSYRCPFCHFTFTTYDEFLSNGPPFSARIGEDTKAEIHLKCTLFASPRPTVGAHLTTTHCVEAAKLDPAAFIDKDFKVPIQCASSLPPT